VVTVGVTGQHGSSHGAVNVLRTTQSGVGPQLRLVVPQNALLDCGTGFKKVKQEWERKAVVGSVTVVMVVIVTRELVTKIVVKGDGPQVVGVGVVCPWS